MATLLVGFDSAWTPRNRGAVVAAVLDDGGSFRDLGEPQTANFSEAEDAIHGWRAANPGALSVILLDQPTVVTNGTGQRPVEHIVSSCVSLRYGGMQPANTGRADMFGSGAPVWRFMSQFGGVCNPLLAATRDAVVIETYPVLTMIALGWLREDPRVSGRLPKYNPQRRKTFSIEDWQFVCRMASSAFEQRGLVGIARWLDAAHDWDRPRKIDQDKLDACLCLLVAVHLAEGSECLMVGDLTTGYIVVPHCPRLQTEIERRCGATARLGPEWVRTFRMRLSA